MMILMFTAVISRILGMGLCTTANYIVVSTLMAPVIVDLGAQNGLIVPMIAIHLFVFYFGILADDIPPVGLAAFAAAGISGGDPIRCGILGFTYDIRTAILPPFSRERIMFKKILVPVDIDYSKTAALVYRKALELGKPGGADIRLVSVMPGFGMPIVASFISEEMVKKAKDRLKAAMETFIQGNCQEPITYTIKTGKNWEEIVKAADKWGAGLIVVYHNREQAVNDVFSNACSQRVMENANCSVLRLRNIRGQGGPVVTH